MEKAATAAASFSVSTLLIYPPPKLVSPNNIALLILVCQDRRVDLTKLCETVNNLCVTQVAFVKQTRLDRIEDLLESHAMRQRELASILGISGPTMSQKIHGTVAFTVRDLSLIADYFDVSVDFLLGRSDYAKPLEVA
ncbi:helix-turn-helix domain-containing protein [Bifidobacterium longum]|nr:helix-turn-helix transcriptional regulator [Bifidobacterium longum]